ncbi:hypothetical protein [Calothrix sp. 336/3]|nr:hypothetical protein [Calothrix sp. 336/3]
MIGESSEGLRFLEIKINFPLRISREVRIKLKAIAESEKTAIARCK